MPKSRSSTQQPVFVTLGPAAHGADVILILVDAEATAVAPNKVVWHMGKIWK